MGYLERDAPRRTNCGRRVVRAAASRGRRVRPRLTACRGGGQPVDPTRGPWPTVPLAGAGRARHLRGGRGAHRPEVRRHVGRRRRPHPERRRPGARATRAAGHAVVVVVSAMAGETNRLLGAGQGGRIRARRAREPTCSSSTGEQVTVGADSRSRSRGAGGRRASFLGHQVRIVTDSAFGRRASSASTPSALERGARRAAESPSSPASRASTSDGNITTLGRGGSDTSAVALAAALERRRAARSTPTSTASTPPIRTSARRRARSSASPTTRCSSWRASAPRCCRSAPSSSP